MFVSVLRNILPMHILTCFAASVLAVGEAGATDYHIDSRSGNDGWTGTRASHLAGTISGPWQTLGRIQEATLLPGDNVILSCGSSWSETLQLNASGSPTMPIKVIAGSAVCENPPLIAASIAVPKEQWSSVSSNIYSASLPVNLAANGKFEDGIGGWRAWSRTSDHIVQSSNNCLGEPGKCLEFTSGTTAEESVIYPKTFSVRKGESIKVSFRIHLALGRAARVVMRRATSPFEPLAASQSVVGEGTWKTYQLVFTANQGTTLARLDFGQSSARGKLFLNDLVISRNEPLDVHQVTWKGKQTLEAHYPGRGYDSLLPDSPYLRASLDSPVDSVTGGTRVVTYGSELTLPPVGTALEGVSVRMRTTAWTIEEKKVLSRENNRLTLESSTRFPLRKDWGYFLVGAKWMLDEPGEWFFEKATQKVFIVMPDGQHPGDDVSVSSMLAGVNIQNLSDVEVSDLVIKNASNGVLASLSTNSAVKGVRIENASERGIVANGAQNILIADNVLQRIGKDGIDATNAATRIASGVSIIRNRLREIGLSVEGNTMVSLPVPVLAAIRAARSSLIASNDIHYSAYAAIVPLQDSTIAKNRISYACQVLDDCGAIYLTGAGHNSLVEKNAIFDIHGNKNGKPPLIDTQAQGVYLDNQTSGVTVRGNTIVRADNGIQVHNAAHNSIERNLFFGNRNYQIWMQENHNRLRVEGDLHSNRVLENTFFPNGGNPSVGMDSIYQSTAQFGTFDRNRYSALITEYVVAEQASTASAVYSFRNWQLATSPAIGPRNMETNGSVVEAIGYASFRVLGSNRVPNGDLLQGRMGWGGWNEVAPYSVTQVSPNCLPGVCLMFSAGASESILSSPNFSVEKEKWYRVTFDLRAGRKNQNLTMLVRRGGGGANGYERLAAPISLVASDGWVRYSFPFQALKTVNANDALTQDFGARLDFLKIMPGDSVSVANVEVVPLSPAQASLETRLLTNSSDAETLTYCPDAVSAPANCPLYVRFSNKQPAAWPILLAPHTSEVVYSRDLSLVDTDSDGISDFQDLCRNTGANLGVNSRGCALLE